MTTPAPDENRTLRVFLIRGVIAIAWAAVFATVAASLTTNVTVVAGVLLVLYPLIDAVATLIDARSQHGSARQWLLINAGASTVAAIALGVAATSGVAAVFVVFGVWAAVSGAGSSSSLLRRRAQLGNQWPLLLANGVSVIGGVAFIVAMAVGSPKLGMLAIYAATGGIEFVIQAGCSRGAVAAWPAPPRSRAQADPQARGGAAVPTDAARSGFSCDARLALKPVDLSPRFRSASGGRASPLLSAPRSGSTRAHQWERRWRTWLWCSRSLSGTSSGCVHVPARR